MAAGFRLCCLSGSATYRSDEMRVRVVTDKYSGFEVQYKKWYWPCWFQVGRFGLPCNTFHSREQAIEFASSMKLAGEVVWEGS